MTTRSGLRRYMACCVTREREGSIDRGPKLAAQDPPPPLQTHDSYGPPLTKSVPGALGPEHTDRWEIWAIPLVGPRFSIWVEGNPLAKDLADQIARRSSTPHLPSPSRPEDTDSRTGNASLHPEKLPPHW